MVMMDVRNISAAEQMRQIVVDHIKELSVTFADLIYYKEIGKFSTPKIAIFRAQLIGFYSILRPKMMAFTNELLKKEPENQLGKDYGELLNFLDTRANNPSKFTLEEMKEVYLYLLQFCEDYDLTRTSIKSISSSDLE